MTNIQILKEKTVLVRSNSVDTVTFNIEMGCDESQPDEKEAPKTIVAPTKTTSMIRSANFSKPDCTVIFIGPGFSGKTTLIRHLKMLYLGGFSDQERRVIRNSIRISIIQLLKGTIQRIDPQLYSGDDDLYESAEYIAECIEDHVGDELNESSAFHINRLWKSPILNSLMREHIIKTFGENDCYLLDSIDRISMIDYIPSDEDIIKVRIMTIGTHENKLYLGEKKSVIYDMGGQLSERKNWKMYYPKAHCIVITLPLSDFDLHLFEDDTKLRFDDSLSIFESIWSIPDINTKKVLIVLNKEDIFLEKIWKNQSGFRDAYNFSGEMNEKNCLEAAVRFFKSKIPDMSPKYPVNIITTCAMNPGSVTHLFEELATIVQS